MDDNQHINVSSAKQLAELNKQKEKEAHLAEEAEKQARKAEAEKIALLKRQNELSEQILKETNKKQRTDLVEIKPNIFGFGANLNEAWRRIKEWWSK